MVVLFCNLIELVVMKISERYRFLYDVSVLSL